MKIIERIFDVATGETTDVERDMTPGELADWNARKAERDLEDAAIADAKIKREIAVSKLASLGIKEDDLKALGLGGN
jgi:hypothetical protein